MEERILSEQDLAKFKEALIGKEAAGETVQKYTRCARALVAYLAGRPLTKELAVEWKESLRDKGLSPATVNGYIAAANAFFTSLGMEDQIRIKSLKIQRRTFTDQKKELTRAEYERLILAAKKEGKMRLSLLFETICATGIRVSEVKYITLEAAQAGRADISLKGKIRTILIPRALCRKLKHFARQIGIGGVKFFCPDPDGRCRENRSGHR